MGPQKGFYGKNRACANHNTKAPAAIGPYSQAIRCGQFVYTSGQIALDPATGEMVAGDVQAQTHRVLQNLQAVLSSAGSSLKSVIKTTVFLAHMSDFQAMNAVYASYFGSPAPARSTSRRRATAQGTGRN